jgi:hypothetical protein
MGAQNEREKKKHLKKKNGATIDQRKKEKNKYNMNNGTLFFDIQL